MKTKTVLIKVLGVLFFAAAFSAARAEAGQVTKITFKNTTALKVSVALMWWDQGDSSVYTKGWWDVGYLEDNNAGATIIIKK